MSELPVPFFSCRYLVFPPNQQGSLFHEFKNSGTLEKPLFHKHDFYEILLIPTGHINVFSENAHVSHNDRCLLIYNISHLHSQINDAKSAYIKHHLNMPPLETPELRHIYEQFCHLITSTFLLIPLSQNELDYLAKPFLRLTDLYNQTNDSSALQDDRVILCLGYLLSEIVHLIQVQPHLNQEKYDRYIISLINYINVHLSEKISLTSLSKQFSVGKTKLNADFRKHVGMSVMQYVIQSRLHLAQDYLHSEMSIEEIAAKAGFFDISHLNHSFRHHLNLTPTEYRKQITPPRKGQ